MRGKRQIAHATGTAFREMLSRVRLGRNDAMLVVLCDVCQVKMKADVVRVGGEEKGCYVLFANAAKKNEVMEEFTSLDVVSL